MASECGFWSFPSFPRSSFVFVAGEVVKVLCRGRLSAFPPPAGRGGEEWKWWSFVFRFVGGGAGVPSSTFQLRPAMVARGAASGGGVGLVVVDLGGAASAGRRVVAGSGCCGRARSARLGSVLQRWTAPAAIYELWRRLLPGGKRYGGAAVA
jgi:hypothetical protein